MKKVINVEQELEKTIQFHVKLAQITILKQEIKEIKHKVVKTTEEADNDLLRQLRISNAAKRAEIELKREHLRARAENIASTKERF